MMDGEKDKTNLNAAAALGDHLSAPKGFLQEYLFIENLHVTTYIHPRCLLNP